MNSYTCPMCGASMTVRKVFDGKVIDCDNDNEECNNQIEVEEGEDNHENN